MRALTRMRSLAAACALLLVVAGTAVAGAPGRPIDRPESPPTGRPTEAGEPDTGQGLVYWQQLLMAAQLSNPWLNQAPLRVLYVKKVNKSAVVRPLGRR